MRPWLIAVYLFVPGYELLRGFLLFQRSGFRFYLLTSSMRMVAWLFPLIVAFLAAAGILNPPLGTFWGSMANLVLFWSIRGLANRIDTWQLNKAHQLASVVWETWESSRKQASLRWKLLVLYPEPTYFGLFTILIVLAIAQAQGWLK